MSYLHVSNLCDLRILQGRGTMPANNVRPPVLLCVRPMCLAYVTGITSKGKQPQDPDTQALRLTSADAQVVTVFLGSFLAGSLFSQFTAWVDHPASAITILGTSAPLTSIFFLNYISLSVCPALELWA